MSSGNNVRDGWHVCKMRCSVSIMERTSDSKLGPTGRRVAENLRELRGRLPVRELSERLRAIGRPILPSGITKIEKGDRRVDADDLVALALVLDVTPNRLLLTPGARVSESVALTPEVGASADAAWFWATGDVPIVHEFAGDVADLADSNALSARLESFVRTNRPHDPSDVTDMRNLVPHRAALEKLATLVGELEAAGVPRKAAYRYVDLYGSDGKG